MTGKVGGRLLLLTASTNPCPLATGMSEYLMFGTSRQQDQTDPDIEYSQFLNPIFPYKKLEVKHLNTLRIYISGRYKTYSAYAHKHPTLIRSDCVNACDQKHLRFQDAVKELKQHLTDPEKWRKYEKVAKDFIDDWRLLASSLKYEKQRQDHPQWNSIDYSQDLETEAMVFNVRWSEETLKRSFLEAGGPANQSQEVSSGGQ